MEELRSAAREVTARARHVRLDESAIAAYALGLPLGEPGREDADDPDEALPGANRETLAAFWLTLDAINFGSGWFPTLRKRAGRSGYNTIALGWRERFIAAGPWSADELTTIDAASVAAVLHQDAGHELMELFAASLNDVGAHVAYEHGGSFASAVDGADGSAVALAHQLGRWASFGDYSSYQELEVPFLKRAQIAAADLHRVGVAQFADLRGLTMFADNLVPHVLRLDGVLWFEPELVSRIKRGDLIAHDSPEEVEIRACAVQAVELIVAARGDQVTAAAVDQMLWRRGQEPRYKSSPRHRTRCTAY